MTTMYSNSFLLMKEYGIVLLSFSFIYEAIRLLATHFSGLLSGFAIYVILTFFFFLQATHAFHYTLIEGKTVLLVVGSTDGPRPNGAFVLAYLIPWAFTILLVVVMTLVALRLHPFEGQEVIGVVLIAFLIANLLSGFLIALIGTMIPAAAVQRGVGFALAIKRAKSTFFFVLWRLAAGPLFLITIVSILTVVMDAQGFVPDAVVRLEDLTVWGGVHQVATFFFWSYIIALTASILSMAYLHAEEGRLPEIGAQSDA